MFLEEFYDYKNQLIGDLMTKESIVTLINENVPFEKAQSLIYDQVFPFEFVPETSQEGKTYICCDVDIQKSDKSGLFYYPIIYVWVFAHKSRLVLPEGGVRTDKLCCEICKAINGSRMYGAGELVMYAARRFAPMTDYQGKCLVFHAKDFNNTYDPKRPIPSNRKTG